MPLEVIEATDPLTQMIRFQTSAVYEMIIGLQNLLRRDGPHTEWEACIRAAMPGGAVAELESLYAAYGRGVMFFELAVDYPDHDDVPGFLSYVRRLDPVEFIFYVVGRILTHEEIAATGLQPDALRAALDAVKHDYNCMCAESPLEDLLADVPAFQNRLADLWQRFWNGFFEEHMAELASHWQRGLDDKIALLSRLGGQAMVEHVTGKSDLPAPLPPDMPVTEVIFIPLYLIPSSIFMFYGYGSVTVLYDSERTEARRAEIERGKEQALAVLKALGDSSRLEILRLIARHEGMMHGKKIAAHLELSASAVSRHLNQLKDAGLIAEESQDNRTITYRLQREAITSLPDRIMDYLYH